MMASFAIGAIGAFAMSVLLLYGVTDVLAVLTTPTGSPVIELVSPSFRQAATKLTCLAVQTGDRLR